MKRFHLNQSITNVSKYNGSDGSITIQAQGGSGIYQYSIDNGATWSISHVFENLKASSYYVLVRDKDDISNITNAVLLTILNLLIHQMTMIMMTTMMTRRNLQVIHQMITTQLHPLIIQSTETKYWRV